MSPGQADAGSDTGASIREARRGVGLMQRELAAFVGVSPHTVWCWEAGRTRPTYEHLAAIAFHCGRDVDELVGHPRHERDLIEETAAAFRRAVLHLPEEDIKFIWTFIRFKRWRRRRLGRAGK
ncbi:MAG: helix-turn-helix transcriptional regulator [Chloroflexota bacterium]|nr:helix-turn-helix transcriptional regulator [Chloroflexota bacterium]